MTNIQPRTKGLAIPAGSDLLIFQEWLRDAENSVSELEYRDTAAEDYKFYAGDQDTRDVKDSLESQSRPTSTFNETKPKVDMMIGLAQQTKHESTIIPVSTADGPLAEVMAGAVKHFQRQLKISKKEIDCFEHTAKSGRSLLYYYIDRTNPFKPKIKTMRLPGWMFYIDSQSIEYDLSDARWLLIEKWLPIEDIQKKWPGTEEGDLEAAPGFGEEQPEFFNEVKDLWRIVEVWYKKYIQYSWFINPATKEPEGIPSKDFPKFAEALLEQGLEVPEEIRTFKQDMYYAIFTGNKILEEGRSPYNWEGFPAIFFGAYKNEDKNSWFGAITMMKDPQRSLNTMLRQLQHLLQTLPKGIFMHETGAVLDIEAYEQRSSEPTYHMEMTRDGLDRARFEKQPAISPIYSELAAVYSQIIKNASGAQDTLLGIQTTSREPGVTVQQRQETGLAVLFLIYENFAESRELSTKLLMSLIQQYVTVPTLIRIEGQEGAQLLEINSQTNPDVEGFNDITAAEFDLAVHDVTETTTMRLSIAQLLTEFSQNNPGVIPPDLILEYTSVPFSVKERIRVAAVEVQELEEAKLVAEQENKERELDLKEKDIEAKITVAEISAAARKSKENSNQTKGKET